MKKTMKKLSLLVALLAMSITVQAQTTFHDVEANEAKGDVKAITSTMMGRTEVVNFTKEGKMQREGLSDVVYDADGYLQSATVEAMGQKGSISYTWENDRVKGTTVKMMGQEIKTTYNYDDKGIVTSSTVNIGGQQIETPFTDYKFDDHGNWISRKTTMMGQNLELTRTIEYYE